MLFDFDLLAVRGVTDGQTDRRMNATKYIVSIFIFIYLTVASAAIDIHVIKKKIFHQQRNDHNSAYITECLKIKILLRVVRYFAPLLF